MNRFPFGFIYGHSVLFLVINIHSLKNLLVLKGKSNREEKETQKTNLIKELMQYMCQHRQSKMLPPDIFLEISIGLTHTNSHNYGLFHVTDQSPGLWCTPIQFGNSFKS